MVPNIVLLIVALKKHLDELKNPRNVKFSLALKIATEHFGKPRIKGSHHIFKMPWQGDPRINLQPDSNKMAKAYQVKILAKALQKLLEENNK